MRNLLDLLKRFHTHPTDVVGVDVGASGTKVVRLKKTKQGITLVAADLLPVVSMPEPGEPGADTAPSPLALPKPLKARYASMGASGQGAVLKLLSVPTQSEKAGELQVNELLGLADGANYRVAYEVISEGHARAESRLLAVALPENRAQSLCGLFPAGTPAPCAIELSGLAMLHSFFRGPGQQNGDECVAVLDFGASSSVLAILSKGGLVLIRKFDVGSDAILAKVEESLGVDRETAQGILSDGSFDVSQLVRESIAVFSQQVIISRDFVERRENCRIRKFYVCGGVTGARDWQNELHAAVGVPPEPWNPFAGLQVLAESFPERLAGAESRFPAAVGVALAAIEEA